MTYLYWIRTQEAVTAFDISETYFNTLRPRQNGRHFADDIFKCIFLNENVWIPIKNSLKFVPQGPINNIPALVQIMAWRRSGDKPLSGPMMVRLPTHICVTRPQWVKRQISRNLIRPHHPLQLPNRFNIWHRQGVGDTKPFPPFRYFPNFSALSNTHYLLKITFIFDKCRSSSATVAPVKYKCESNDLRDTFARSKTLLTETLTNGALVTPQPWYNQCDCRALCKGVQDDLATSQKVVDTDISRDWHYKFQRNIRLNTWLQWIRQLQLPDKTRNIQVLGFGAAYIRGFMVLHSLYTLQIGIIALMHSLQIHLYHSVH